MATKHWICIPFQAIQENSYRIDFLFGLVENPVVKWLKRQHSLESPPVRSQQRKRSIYRKVKRKKDRAKVNQRVHLGKENNVPQGT